MSKPRAWERLALILGVVLLVGICAPAELLAWPDDCQPGNPFTWPEECQPYNPYTWPPDCKPYNPFTWGADCQPGNPFTWPLECQPYNPYTWPDDCKPYNPFTWVFECWPGNPFTWPEDCQPYTPFTWPDDCVPYNPFTWPDDCMPYSPITRLDECICMPYNPFTWPEDCMPGNPFTWPVDECQPYNPYTWPDDCVPYNPFTWPEECQPYNPHTWPEDCLPYNPFTWPADCDPSYNPYTWPDDCQPYSPFTWPENCMPYTPFTWPDDCKPYNPFTWPMECSPYTPFTWPDDCMPYNPFTWPVVCEPGNPFTWPLFECFPFNPFTWPPACEPYNPFTWPPDDCFPFNPFTWPPVCEPINPFTWPPTCDLDNPFTWPPDECFPYNPFTWPDDCKPYNPLTWPLDCQHLSPFTWPMEHDPGDLLTWVHPPDPVTIEFWHRFSERHNETLEQLATWFEEIYPNINVEWVYQGSYSALQQSINGAVVAGEVPTMTIFYEDWIPAVADALLPLGPYFTAEETADIIPGLLYKDMLTVPFNKSIMVLYYIEDYVPVPPTTWQEFYDLCVANTVDEDGDGQIDRYGTGLRPAANPEQFLALLEQNNGTILNEDSTAVTLDNEAGVEALEFYASLAPYAWITSEYLNSAIGYVAMAIDTSAGYYYWNSAAEGVGLTVKTAALPVGEKPASFIQGTNIGIFKDAPYDERAAGILFLKFLLEADNTAYWAAQTGYLPVTLSGLQSQTWVDHLAMHPEAIASSEMMPLGVSSLSHPNYGDMRAALGTMCEEILLGANTLVDALAAVVDEIAELLELR